MKTSVLSSVKPSPASAPKRTMTAGRVHEFGPPQAIKMERVETPVPEEGQVLVRVGAAGVGPWDAWVRAGKSVLPQPLPLTLGSDISGEIVSVGPGVSGFEPGEAVFGVTNPRFTNGYAEYAPAFANMLAPKPETLSDIEAASVPVISVTAWQMLFEHAAVTKGQTVFVNGGAGNVGAFAVQLAHNAGAHVYASAFANDADYVSELGADGVYDLRKDDLGRLGRSVDAVIDTVGGETQAKLFDLLKPGGIFVSAVSQPDADRAKALGVRTVFFVVNVNTSDLTRIAAMLDAGRLAARVGTVLPLADARLAHEMLEGLRRHDRGKIVLRVTPEEARK